MDQVAHLPSGARQLNLKKSFRRGIRSILTACPKEEFCKAFSAFTHTEQENLHRLFIQVITSLHENIEEEFESLCQETQVATALDTLEQFVEEQSLDILSTEKTNSGDLKEEVSKAKRNEIHYLTRMLELEAPSLLSTIEANLQILKLEIQINRSQFAVQQKNDLKAQVDSLKKEEQELSTTYEAVEKFRSWNMKYGQIS